MIDAKKLDVVADNCFVESESYFNRKLNASELSLKLTNFNLALKEETKNKLLDKKLNIDDFDLINKNKIDNLLIRKNLVFNSPDLFVTSLDQHFKLTEKFNNLNFFETGENTKWNL